MTQKIIDVHMHPDFDNKSMIDVAKEAGVNFSLSGISKDFRKHNIVKAVALPTFTHYSTKEKLTYAVRNEKIRKLVSENKDKFVGACTLNPLECNQDQMDTIEKDVRDGVFRAIKLFLGYEPFYPNQKECDHVYEMAHRNKIPVMFHTGDTWARGAKLKYTHPLNIDDVAVSFPDVKFVVCHLGNPWITDAVEVLSKNKNVYADLSGFFVGKLDQTDKRYTESRIKAVNDGISYDTLILDKLMFGTDYPLTNYDFYINFIKKLDLNKREFDKIFFENASKLFKVTI